ncbi:MAG TPA: alanine--tRNA ligase [Ruminococcaceae bacterium]|nr:alanine--tRNA ligase [Oscillospiraceae bacterium]
MKWTSLNEIREKYLAFFEEKEHLRVKSFPLIPQNDNSLLLINSGMAPMKKYFTGEVTPPSKRVTSCQKCIRTPDIERVGKTARHGTYFEMLGNFSFGDYFKREAAAWAWEFSTKVMEMPVDRLWVSIYLDDDEAFEIWTKEIGVSPERIVRLGKEDNFWEHGVGPCGPCSEIYFDRGEKYGCDEPGCTVGCDCDRFVEFWNLVFTQFDSDGKGNYTPLANPNIDTGMGLERLACIAQEVDNLFEVDTVQDIIRHISEYAGVAYKSDAKKDVSLRVIADHIRSTTFMIGDGVLPSNEGRGYVLRRLLRRAARHGRLLGIKDPFLSEISKTVIKANQSAYPELTDKQELIVKLISVEEESFNRTIDQGLQMLEDMMKTAKHSLLSGEDAFRLYDTFGFPVDLTKDILEENGLDVDLDAFEELMKQQKERARGARKDAGADAWKGDSNPFQGLEPTRFIGYDALVGETKILAVSGYGESADTVLPGENAALVLLESPFYAESGGQVGDRGIIKTSNMLFDVENTFKTEEGVYVHSGTLKEGVLSAGKTVIARVDKEIRLAVMRNHTAAHLLQAALRNTLGAHVQQAGQLVDGHRMRFDFTHFSALTKEELGNVEREINRNILSGLNVNSEEMPIDKAREKGAMALFGEKYGDVVRVVTVDGSVSAELCGGTHVRNTGEMGLFHILSENSVASGVRRIEAVTGYNVLGLLNSYHKILEQTSGTLKTNSENLGQKVRQILDESKEKDRKLEQLTTKLAAGRVEEILKQARDINGFKAVTAVLENTDPGAARGMCDRLRELSPDVVGVLAAVQKEKGTVTFAAVCGKAALEKRAHAGNLVREVAKIAGGSGGGRAESAMAGAKELSKINDALESVYTLLENI